MDKPFSAYEGDEPYVFVCYSHADAKTVYPQLTWLRDQGVNVWYDEGIEAGTVWRRRLAQAIEGASRCIFFVSRASIHSPHCNHEIDYAVDKEVEVVPVYLEDTELTPELQLVLSRVQALYPANDPKYSQRLLQVLCIEPGQSIEQAPSIKPTSPSPLRSKIAWLAAGLAGAAVAVLGYWYVSLKPADGPRSMAVAPPPAAAQNSIAVIAPRVIGNDPALSTFGEIVAQDVRGALGRFQNLQLVNVQGAAGSEYSVGGTLRAVEGGVRVSIELKRTVDGMVLWSKSLDEHTRTLNTAEFPRAEYVAYSVNSIVTYSDYRNALKERGATNDQRALNSFFAGLVESDAARLGDGNYRLVIEHYKRAIALDPEFTEAYARLALTYGFRGQGQISVEEALSSVTAILPKLAAFDTNPAVARALVFVKLRLLLDYDAAERHLNTLEAISSLPAFQLQWMRCTIQWARGQLTNALDHCAAHAASSGGSLEYYSFGLLLHLAGRHREAADALQRSLDISDSSQTGSAENGVHNNAGYHLLDMLVRSQYLAGDSTAATAILNSARARQLDWYPKEYAASLALLGKPVEAGQAVAAMNRDELLGRSVEPNERFWAFYYMGELDDAFQWLQRAVASRDVFTIGALKSSPLFSELRMDPRFAEVMTEIKRIEDNP